MASVPLPFARLCLIAAAMLMLVVQAPALAASDAAPAPRDSLFRAADRELAAANAARANLLAPTSYGEAAEYYRRAEAKLESGADREAIERDAQRAAELFHRASLAAAAAAPLLAPALDARSDAEEAEARKHDDDAWMQAERELHDAAVNLERGRERPAERQADKALELFRALELAAIKANYLSETAALLEVAEDLRARRHAPLSFARAQEQLAEAEQALTSDRYDTDRPRHLARSAQHEAHQAIYVSRLERDIRGNDTSLEQILLGWQGALRSIADSLDVPVHFDDGHATAAQRIIQAIDRLKADSNFLQQGLERRDAEIASLERELGGQSASLERVNQMLARRERQQQRLARVEELFEAEQAMVLRQSDNLTLRMIGLNFDSGRSSLKTEHDALLKTVQRALTQFPEANIVVEGHTDSFGSDAQNLTLSQARAEAVMQYLLTHAPLSPMNLKAVGYGESKPVANNETPEGRRRNRRIDIVIYPGWD